MNNILLYLLKVSAATTLFYLCYLLLFRKDTFYKRNRILLILILLLPTVLPALKIPVTVINQVPLTPANSFDNIIFSETLSPAAQPGTINSFNYNGLLLWIYFTIAGLLLLRAVISMISTCRIIKKGAVESGRFPKVIVSDFQLPPFSFYPYAVIPAEEYKKGNYRDILDHEFAHIRQGHTFDLLISELFIAFQWFNPFVWLIKRSIILNHEYLADHISLINKSAKDYQYRLISFKTGLRDISLAHSFNSLIKNRIIMINKKPTRRFAALKNIIILPVAAFVVYAFATPEYKTVALSADPESVTLTPGMMQKEVKGIVTNKDGKPLDEVQIVSTGTLDNASHAFTGKDGRFSLTNVESDASIIFSCNGYKQLIMRPDFTLEMNVKMEKDPEYRKPAEIESKTSQAQSQGPIAVIDGVISEKKYFEAEKDLGYNMGISKFIRGKEATDKYGEKGANGVIEITTRKKALEMGLKPPFPRLAPEDYPTFMNQWHTGFTQWVGSHAEYPEEAREQKLEGWVTIRFDVELDGSVSNIVSTGQANQILVDEVIRVVKSSPKWDAPKNPAVDAPYSTSTTLKFKLPDQVIVREEPFVVVEKMPMFPGGDLELLNFIKNNARYPEEAKSEKIEGRVIVRFIVNTEGNAEDVTVIKGVHPLLDAEAVRVTSILTGFEPGMQGGKPVNVWYMVPVNFVLPKPEPAK